KKEEGKGRRKKREREAREGSLGVQEEAAKQGRASEAAGSEAGRLREGNRGAPSRGFVRRPGPDRSAVVAKAGAMRGWGRPWLLLLLALVGARREASAQPSKVSRSVALPFVFDPHAACRPPCQHGGL
ncbi:hypothetical protein JRQ81_018646, partial [Phrynocephalus forsythii]